MPSGSGEGDDKEILDQDILFFRLHGGYEVLDSGNLPDTLVDFTGGVSEVIKIDDDQNGYKTDDLERKKSLFKLMTTDIEDRALMCCAIGVSWKVYPLRYHLVTLNCLGLGGRDGAEN